MCTLADFIIKCSTAGLEVQKEDGSMPPGHNGPWLDPETPVRNTAHWAITFLEALQITGEDRFKKAALNALNFLEGPLARPHNKTFHCREKGPKEQCNGLIGQAWAMEALIVGASRLEKPELASLAMEVFKIHPFESNLGLWEMVEIDGIPIGFKRTTNQQVWFAVMGAELAAFTKNKEAEQKVSLFLKNLPGILGTNEDGCFFHRFQLPDGVSVSREQRSLRKNPEILYRTRMSSSGFVLEENPLQLMVGYHSFLLHGLARLKRTYPENPVWQTPALNRAINFVQKDIYQKTIWDNPFCFRYNPTGLEVAFSLGEFEKGEETLSKQKEWVQRQIGNFFDDQKNLMTLGSPDPNTSAARFYQSYDLLNQDPLWGDLNLDISFAQDVICRENLPVVSIIIPVFNDAHELRQTLLALQMQDYPRDRFEVIVVDNGSTDDSYNTAQLVGADHILIENNFSGSPYSSRNRGIEISRGDLVAFLDSTCRPTSKWLSSAVLCFQEKNADLVAGDVLFRFDVSPTVAEFFDSITNIRMRESVNKGYAKTANLVVKRSVIEAIGIFPEAIRSGGDVRWTSKAVSNGKRLIFCEQAFCTKPARKFRELLKKQWRVAIHQPAIWSELGQEVQLSKIILKIFYPPSYTKLAKQVKESGNINTSFPILSLWLIAWLVRVVMSLGNIYGLFFKRDKLVNHKRREA